MRNNMILSCVLTVKCNDGLFNEYALADTDTQKHRLVHDYLWDYHDWYAGLDSDERCFVLDEICDCLNVEAGCYIDAMAEEQQEMQRYYDRLARYY